MDISCQILETNVALVWLKGRLDATTSPGVKSLLKDLIDHGQDKIVVDLEAVPFIDSSGLASLVSGLRLIREQGGTLLLSGVQPQAQTVFRLTMLDRVFLIHPTVDDARRSLV